MARPSQNIDKKLIELGKQKMIESGISGVSIRSICMDAGINLGMFYYYFKTKENFIKILFKALSADLESHWKKETEGLETAEAQLKKVLMNNAMMMRDKKRIFETLIKDVDLFDEFYVQLLKEMRKQWYDFYVDLIEECKKEGCLDKKISNEILISVLIGGFSNYIRTWLEFKNGSEEEFYAAMEECADFLIKRFR